LPGQDIYLKNKDEVLIAFEGVFLPEKSRFYETVTCVNIRLVFLSCG